MQGAGALAAKNFIISMEFWVLVQDGGEGGRAGARKNATELMGGLAVLLVQKRACLKLGRKRGRINKKWMTIHLLLIGVQFSFIFTSSIMTSCATGYVDPGLKEVVWPLGQSYPGKGPGKEKSSSTCDLD